MFVNRTQQAAHNRCYKSHKALGVVVIPSGGSTRAGQHPRMSGPAVSHHSCCTEQQDEPDAQCVVCKQVLNPDDILVSTTTAPANMCASKQSPDRGWLRRQCMGYVEHTLLQHTSRSALCDIPLVLIQPCSLLSSHQTCLRTQPCLLMH